MIRNNQSTQTSEYDRRSQMNSGKAVRPIIILTENNLGFLYRFEGSRGAIPVRPQGEESGAGAEVTQLHTPLSTLHTANRKAVGPHLENCTGKKTFRLYEQAVGIPVRSCERSTDTNHRFQRHLNSLRNGVGARDDLERESRGKIKRIRAQGGCHGTDCR